jgi:hypothetical protein
MKRPTYFLSALLLLALLAGCGSSRLTSATAQPVPTNPPTPVPPTLQPTDTPTPPPQPTLQPTATPTPKPTATWVPTVTPRPAIPTETIPAELLATMEEIEAEIEELRELESSAPITRTLMTQEELTAYMEARFAEDYPPEEVADDVLVLATFDFVSRDFDLLQVLLDFYSSEILGLYDDELNRFYIITSGEFDLRNRITHAHEYVHGLQDQNLGLDEFVDGDKLTDDELLARLALVEGDATLAMSEYLLANLSELSAGELATLAAEDPEGYEESMAATPAIIRETFSFPYRYGLDFVSLLQEEGWGAVDAAYADPPQSSEQILHPEKYFSRDEPQIIALPPLTDTLGAGWRLVEAETLGEFQTNLYLAQQVEQSTADLASQGWDGDQYAVYANDGAVLLALSSVWDTQADQEEFVSAYAQYAEAKFGQPPTLVLESEMWWETPAEVAVLTWAGDRVLIVLGPDQETTAKVLKQASPW